MDSLILIPTIHFDCDNDVPLMFEGMTLLKANTEQDLDNEIADGYVWFTLGNPFKRSLLKGHFFIYRIPFESSDKLGKTSLLAHNRAQHFLKFLWFIKDCSAQSVMFGAYAKDKASGLFQIGQPITNANGLPETVLFSINELREAFEIQIKYFEKVHIVEAPKFDFTFKDTNTFRLDNPDTPYNSLNRVQRALNFLEIARVSAHLPQKISFYVLVLECLFSANDGTEVLYKVRARAARYIEETFESRLKVFNAIKVYYAIRSKYVHGQELEKKHNNLDVLTRSSIELDQLLRKILTRVIVRDSDKFLMPESELRQWFEEDLLK